MKVGILGDGLTSLALAKMLVNKCIYVDLLSEDKAINYSQSRTFGITKKNFDFFTHKILDIKKISWKLSNIEIYTENLPNQKILEFKKTNSKIFSIIRNDQLYKNLNIDLKSNKFFKKKSILSFPIEYEKMGFGGFEEPVLQAPASPNRNSSPGRGASPNTRKSTQIR